MQLSHQNAERKYQNLRDITYELTMEELPYQDRENIILSEINDKAVAYFQTPEAERNREVDWHWGFGIQTYRKRYPNRFELAVWYNNQICGLSLGRPSYNGSKVRLDFIERAPIDHNPLKGRLTPISVTAYEVYARLIDAEELRIMFPDEALIDYYSSLNFTYIKGGGTPMNPSYLYKQIRKTS